LRTLLFKSFFYLKKNQGQKKQDMKKALFSKEKSAFSNLEKN